MEKIICNLTPLGIRNNIYSSSFGLIKYFENKMNFRDVDYTMFDSNDIDILTTKKENSSTIENLLEKFHGYLKD